MVARRLMLIRHSVPDIRPEVAPALWDLSPDGIARARAFATRVEPGTADRILTSAEPKAVQTARVFAECWNLPVEEVSGLHEHERPEPRMLPRERFEARVRELFARPTELVFGAETADTARVRFTDAILRLVRRTDRDVVVISHGTVIALFVAAHSDVDAFTFWFQLQMPCAVTLALPELRLEELAV